MNLFVGNLNPVTTAEGLRQLFSEFGEVVSSKIIFDPSTGQPRGFGFVEMADKFHSFDAIDNIDATFFEGNVISVKEAKSNDKGGGRKPGGFRPGGGNRPGGFRPQGGGGGYRNDRPDRTDRPDRNDRGERSEFKPRTSPRFSPNYNPNYNTNTNTNTRPTNTDDDDRFNRL